jgi:uncharacterized protein YjbI with pentapeptide repeats
MAGNYLGKYSITPANNSTTSTSSISVAEGMLPSNINNAFRDIMADVRQWYNDGQWIEYGDGSGTYTPTYVSTTAFTIDGVDVTSVYHAGRRIKLIATTPGTIYGTVSSTTFSTNTTVNVTWDSGSLSNEAITNVYVGILSKTNSSIPSESIGSTQIADGSITTAKLAADAVTNAKIADDSIDSEHYVDGSIDTAHIGDSQITTAKIADSNVTTAKIAADAITNAKIADDSIDSEHYVDGSIDTAHIGDLQITTAKIADSNITTAKIADSNVTTAKIVDSNVTTAKINDDAVTAAKIADAVIVTNAEHSAHTPDDVTFFTTSASDARYFRQDSSETISSGDTWSASDSYVATTAAIDARVIDLVDDVGGFYPITNETSFPNTNPDVNDGAGTIISIKEIASTRTPAAGTVTIASGTLGGSTVTITGCGSTVLTAGFGVLVETTSTLNTYAFHRLSPKATEVTTVASISGDITTVANDGTDIGVVAGLSTDIQNLADIEDGTTATDAISNVGNNISDVTAVATNLTGSNTIGTVATDLSGSDNIGTVGTDIVNVNLVGGSIGNVNTVATNIADVNSFANTYRIAASAPVTSLDVGDLYFDTTANELKVYKASGWSAAGSTVNGTSARFTYNITGTPSSVSGSDANGDTLAYDAGFADVYVNGVRMSSSDITITSGTSVVFATALSDGDVVDVVAYGTFNVAAIDASNITSGNLNIARIADGSITNAKLVNSSITINGSPVSLGGSVTVSETKPTITSITPDTIDNTQTSIVITGTNFVITPQVEFINTSTGIWYIADTVTRDLATQLTINATLAVDGNYKIRIENPDGNAVLSSTALLTVSDAPTWSTSAGSLGSIAAGSSASFTVSATSDSAVTYSITSGALPGGLSLNSSTGAITGTESGATAETNYNFTVTATDAESQTAPRAFTITVSVGINNSGQFN